MSDREELPKFAEADVARWLQLAGVDPTDHDDMTLALSVGLTIILWRNTEFENAQVGFVPPIPGVTDNEMIDLYESHVSAHQVYLNDLLQPLTRVADPREKPRIDAILAGLPLGLEIPADVMMRANTHTTHQVLRIIQNQLDEKHLMLNNPSQDPTDFHTWITHLCDHLANPDRPVTLGCETIPASALFSGYNGFPRYVRDLHEKAADLIDTARRVGNRFTIATIAITGATYSRHWAFTPAWEAAVRGYQADKATAPHETPNYWQALAHTPWLLNGKQAAALNNSALETVHIREAWKQRRDRISPDPSKGAPMPALI